MHERPILFSAPMVRAILEGRKTQTRRAIKVPPDFVTDHGDPVRFTPDDPKYGRLGVVMPCPYGQPGDRLWVREAWRAPVSLDDLSGKQIAEKCLDAGYRHPWCPMQFEANGARTSEKDWREFGPHPSTTVPGRYRHARFMPRWASRITLEVTGVRVERLQDISAADCIAEGIEPAHTCDANEETSLVRAAYATLWESINGDGSWDANPWVWVVEFPQVEQGAKAA